MSDLHDSAAVPDALICPACGFVIEPAVDTSTRECPACGTLLGNLQTTTNDASTLPADEDAPEEIASDEFAIHDDSDAVREAREASENIEPHDADDLSTLRIRQISATQRGANTLRFYGIIGLLFLATELVDAAMRYREAKRGHWVLFVALFLAVGCFIPIAILLRRIVRTNRAFKKTAIPDPEIPPDLSALSDGSQHLQNLEAFTGNAGHNGT